MTLNKTDSADVVNVINNNIARLKGSLPSLAMKSSVDLAQSRLTPLTSKDRIKLDKKVSTAKYLINKGDMSFAKNDFKDAFRMYRIALETLK